MIARRLLLVGMLIGLALPLAGCNKGPKMVTVKGSLVRNGAPIALGPMGVAQLILEPDVAQGEEFTTYPAPPLDASGKFEIKDVPEGKYKVIIRLYDPYPSNDTMKGAYESATTKYKVDIDGTKPLDIDVAK